MPLQRLLIDFRDDRGGQIAILFAVASVAIFGSLGAGIDLATAYAARQRLSDVATLACQYSTRASISQTAVSSYPGVDGFQAYVAAVNAFVMTSLSSQHWTGPLPKGAGGTVGGYFTATPAAGGSSSLPAAAVPSNPVVEMSTAVPTAFGKILAISSIPVHARIACLTLANAPQVVNPNVLLKEGFEAPCALVCFNNPGGGTTLSLFPTNSFPSSAGYVGYNGYKWFIVGYCLETDAVGLANSSVPEGTHAAELDCDNGLGLAGNSSISTSLYLAAGQYELRYNYRSRIDYPNYDPVYICGSTAFDVSWANDSDVLPRIVPVQRTNQINVYLDANIPGTNGSVGSAPLHKTIDGLQSLAGSNLIDVCVYAPTWIERSVRFKVTTPGSYWLSFAADGANDSNGGQLDNIRLCQGRCAGAPQDNFPPSWLAGNNGGLSKTLFEDSFETPSYLPDFSNWINKTGNLGLSMGSLVYTGCLSGALGSPPGWPCQVATGWSTAPYNQVNYILQGAQKGSQYIALDGFNGYSLGFASRNRSISRPFLLDPGYYQVSYFYIADVGFSALGDYGVSCSAAPTTGPVFPGSTPNQAGFIRFYQSTAADLTTNIVGAFMSHSLMVSTPIGGGLLGSPTLYINPDGSLSLTPTTPPDAVNWQNYDATASNPVLDACSNAFNFQWVPRSVAVRIVKPGLYWLTFSANGGVADGNGGGIDDVKLIALGSPYMPVPPSLPLVTVPTPMPLPDSSYTPATFDGFSIVASPFAPPGADQ